MGNWVQIRRFQFCHGILMWFQSKLPKQSPIQHRSIFAVARSQEISSVFQKRRRKLFCSMGCSCGGKKSDDILLVKCGGGPWHSAGPFIWHACPYLEAPLQRGPGVCMPSRSHDQQVQHSLNLAQNSKNREGGMGAPHR